MVLKNSNFVYFANEFVEADPVKMKMELCSH